MNVRVAVLFDRVDEQAWDEVESLGLGLTNQPTSVRVSPLPDKADWLLLEFTMPAMRQMDAVDHIDGAMRLDLLERMDSVISFPRTAAEQARAERKNARRRFRRRQKRVQGGDALDEAW
ncbi:MAG: hypothetical protein U1E05_04330 [Patescibacteria group bacterium]|nr:hypothetical protein [Patescibacteria group bacterium]